MKFIGVREFKQDAVKYLNEGAEIVVMKRKKPIAPCPGSGEISGNGVAGNWQGPQ